MRVLMERPVAIASWSNALVRSKDGFFGISLGLCLAAYVLALALHPAADGTSLYPEPVGNPLYDANFPTHRGADAWALAIHSAAANASCGGISGPYYREVAGPRCHALLESWIGTTPLTGMLHQAGDARCHYHYANEQAARAGTDVRYVTLAGTCAARSLR